MLVALQSCISDDMTALQKDPLPEANTHVSMDQARQRLIKVLGKTEPATRGFSVNIGEGIALNKEAEPLTRAQGDEAWYYYFTINNGEKFAIMSARNDLPELLAIGNGTPEKDDPTAIVPDTLRWNINNIARGKQLPVDSTWLSENDTVFYVRGETHYTFPYRHLCPVKWDQCAPYNKFVEFDTILGETPNAGCVATATAQFMASVKCRPTHYKEVYFDWDTLVKYPTTESLVNHPEVLDSVAKLLIYLGEKENLNMKYGGDDHGYTSTVSPYNIPRTLLNFGFAKGGSYVPFSVGAVIGEFEEGYPVIMRGHSSALPIGHQFILQGLMKAETIVGVYNRKEMIDSYTEVIYYFDVNWGWGARGDGYYLSTGFNSLVPPDYNPDNNPSIPDDDSWEGNFDGYNEVLVGARYR